MATKPQSEPHDDVGGALPRAEAQLGPARSRRWAGGPDLQRV
ncbi:MAG TPA: hypothetical protein VFL66_02580 [Gaiellaceae bacterium]|nr:hypothetical protein [Gaiellaceae bacterium]